MEQTLFIDDEPSKAFQNSKWTKLFFEQFRGGELIKKGVMVRPCILVVVDLEGFTLCKDDLSPFCSHYVILKVVI